MIGAIIKEIPSETYSDLPRTPESRAAPIFELCGVDAQIEGRSILRGIDWRVASGEHWGIIGANGAGKTTLLELVSGRRWPAPGRGQRRYCFAGKWQRDAVEARRRVTLVGPELQDYYMRLGWNFSAADVVVTGIHKTEIPRRRASLEDHDRARGLLAEVDALALADRTFLSLSHGEQRRVLIARALAFAPEILLLDEPANGLDQQARRALEQTIAAAAEHATVIAAAHGEAQLPDVVRRIVEISAGSVAIRDRRDTLGERRPRFMRASIDTASKPRSDPLIEIDRADVWLGEVHALKAISWRLQPNEHWLVRGPNGSGKSTFLRLLHGQVRPARGGAIRWPGLGAPRDVWTLRRQVAWVAPELQASYVHPTTVAACVASGFTSSVGQTRAPTATEHARCEQLLDEFGLLELRDRRLSQLSYGQARRVLLARTLATRPRVLLLDEPWEGLDLETIDLVLQRLSAAMAQRTQIVCASHVGDMGLGLTKELRLHEGAVVA